MFTTCEQFQVTRDKTEYELPISNELEFAWTPRPCSTFPQDSPQRASPRGRASHKGHRRGVAPPTFVPRVVPVLEVSLDVGGTGCAGRDFFDSVQN